jgi:ribonuclease-3
MTTDLEQKLGHVFRDRSLLDTALTHSSYANERRGQGNNCNERLEFLGDSVLGVTVAEHLYRRYGDMPEGRMTRLRSELVCEQSLYRVAQKLELGRYLRLGRGEEHNGGRERPSILSDAVEALIAALYLDGGTSAASAFIHTWLLSELDESEPVCFTDFKTALQELVQRRSGQSLSYELIGEQGPDHAKLFTVQVLLNGSPVGQGDGRTKKEAEQAAAHNALEALRQ